MRDVAEYLGANVSLNWSVAGTREIDDITHTRLAALFRHYPGEPVPEGKTNLDFTEARGSE